MRSSGVSIDRGRLVGAILIGGFLLMLGAGLPGHLSNDSIAQLYEGHFHVRETWGPAIYAWLLGFFDGLIPGASLYVTASALLLFLSLTSLRGLRPTTSWLGVAAAGLLVISPTIAVYQAIVWKDVLFANCAVAGCVLLAHAAHRWDQRGARLILLAGVVLMLAVGGLVRQNGLLVAVCAALATAAVAHGGWLRRLTWGAALFGAVLVVNVGLGAASTPRASGPDVAVNTGLRILQQYDLVGAAATDPNFRLPAIEESAPASAPIIRSRADAAYSAERVDFLTRDNLLGDALWMASPEAIQSDWLNLATRHPGLYLKVRGDVFWWVFATPDIGRCLPAFVGVDGHPGKMTDLNLPYRLSLADREIYDYTVRLAKTPIYSHLSYAGLAVVVGVILLLRREPADLAMAALMAGALAFAASFFVISIACDYRYIYFLDLAALTGAFYLALDPRLKRRNAEA